MRNNSFLIRFYFVLSLPIIVIFGGCSGPPPEQPEIDLAITSISFEPEESDSVNFSVRVDYSSRSLTELNDDNTSSYGAWIAVQDYALVGTNFEIHLTTDGDSFSISDHVSLGDRYMIIENHVGVRYVFPQGLPFPALVTSTNFTNIIRRVKKVGAVRYSWYKYPWYGANGPP